MRITFVLPFFSRRPIGGLRVVYEFAGGLSLRGHHVTVIHPKNVPGIPAPKTLRERAAKFIEDFSFPRGVPWMGVQKDVELRAVPHISSETIPDSDVVFATSWRTAKPVSLLPQKKGQKHYLVMDFYPYLGSRETLEASWNSGFRIATISRWLRDIVVEAGVSTTDVVAVSCGVSPLHRSRTPLETREASIVMMYGTANYKSVGDALIAADIVRSEYGSIPIRLFGPNFSRRPKTLPQWAEYFPLLSDQAVSDLYNRSAVFVSSSLAEGFCLPAAEAMASGCAVVATDCGGIRDFAKDGSNALLSEPGKPRDLAANIVKVLRDSDLRLRLARSGIGTMATHTWERAVGRLEGFLLGQDGVTGHEQ
jgi:glycosyltransferase involved in cell wall biosynthesis